MIIDDQQRSIDWIVSAGLLAMADHDVQFWQLLGAFEFTANCSNWQLAVAGSPPKKMTSWHACVTLRKSWANDSSLEDNSDRNEG